MVVDGCGPSIEAGGWRAGRDFMMVLVDSMRGSGGWPPLALYTYDTRWIVSEKPTNLTIQLPWYPTDPNYRCVDDCAHWNCHSVDLAVFVHLPCCV
jgi:hypothetical protein